MPKKLMQQLSNEIADALCARSYSFSANRRALLARLRTPGCLEGLVALLPIRARLTCAQVLDACIPAMESLSTTPEEGWMPYCYRYIQHLMYPDAACFCPATAGHQRGAQLYLTVLQLMLQKERNALPFDPYIDFALLNEEEIVASDSEDDYRRLMNKMHEEYIYELMRLGQEITPYQTLGHIGGVHFVAATVARELSQSGFPVDLALISGAALAHDFGKFGCHPGERVPYLHYYYTDQWLLARNMERISHIASNHSTWDLELDSLSVESLCLIYADFRSKQVWDENRREIPTIFPLDEAFAVILKKLDDVDNSKRRRYQLVYSKLHDFETYLLHRGVDVTLTNHPTTAHIPKNAALLSSQETVQALTMLSVEHNLRLMHRLSSERKFGNLIESAHSAKNWQELRAYLDIFGEYFTYLSASQKTQALTFLYELLIHRDGDIRRHAAALIGQIIARFHLVYRKEVPADTQVDPAEEVPFTLWDQYLHQIIYPDHKTTEQQRSHIGYTLKLVVDSMLTYSRRESIPRFVGILLDYYKNPEEMEEHTAFTLLDAMHRLPAQYYNENERESLIGFACYFADNENSRLQTAALQFFVEISHSLPRDHAQMRRMVAAVGETPKGSLTINFLRYRLLESAGDPTYEFEALLYQQDITGAVFLDNLKIATPWISKVVAIDLLIDQVNHGLYQNILHIATHFSNLLKVSERVVVRHKAGEGLMMILPHLRNDQRNEIVVELGKGLEMGQYEISKYIPQYLGKAVLFLHPHELDEQVLWLKSLLGSTADSSVAGALNTIGVILQHYPAYQAQFAEEESVYENRRQELLGVLLQGLSHYREGVRQESLLVIGRLLFGSEILTMEQKAELFSLCCRKLLFLIREGGDHGELMLYFRAAALAHVSRFISLWQLDHGPFVFHSYKKIAFFPGTFDPFTLSHKGIVHAIRDLGFEVYLAVDDFSWSKKSRPHLIRRQIVNLSVAGDFHVHLFPDNIPVNIANPTDLHRLNELFDGQEVYLVVGSDVVRGASSYHNPPARWSIHSMKHIIFHRAGQEPLTHTPITADVVNLHLPAHLEDISSSRIRENVDLNRDISSFVDPVIQDFIYQNSLYLRDKQDKPLLFAGSLDFQWEASPTQALLSEVISDDAVRAKMLQNGDQMILLRHTRGQLLGYIAYRYLPTSQLFSALGDPHLADRIRLSAAGKSLLLTSIFSDTTDPHKDYLQLLLSEVLAQSLKDDCVYGLYAPYEPMPNPTIIDTLRRQGFVQRDPALTLYEVEMHTPQVLLQNLETTIQEPLCYNSRVLAAIRLGHEQLQTALTALYPGTLLLTLSSDVIHQRLLDMITAFNEVPRTPTTPRKLGNDMCVPYGKLLRSKTVPNTVTKTLHTDKVFDPDLNTNAVEAFPFYAPIPSQIRTIKSFNRPVILVDDIMHTGYRFRTLDPILREENVDIHTVLVGLMSGYGRDVMHAWDRPVDSVYFLPRLRHWFVESTLYPFIGGNTVRRSTSPVPGLLPGINHILPYATPTFLSSSGQDAIFNLSRCCLESAHNVIVTLEQEYRSLYARNLTLSRLPEAIILPLCPDKGKCLHYDPNLAASIYLENDLEQLLRTHR